MTSFFAKEIIKNRLLSDRRTNRQKQQLLKDKKKGKKKRLKRKVGTKERRHDEASSNVLI